MRQIATAFAQAFDNTVRSIGMNYNSFCLLLSDAAKYMVATGAIQKFLYPKLFRATCVADILHICAMKVKSYLEVVDQLIAKVKSATVKNKIRQAKFATIGRLLQDEEAV